MQKLIASVVISLWQIGSSVMRIRQRLESKLRSTVLHIVSMVAVGQVLAAGSVLKIASLPDDLSAARVHLLGTNMALWYEPEQIAADGFMGYLERWSPGLIRLPGGSWSNEYYWNGNGVRTDTHTFDQNSYKNGKWDVEYSAYAPGFRVESEAQHLSDYHGVIDVKTQHDLAESIGAEQMVTVNVGSGSPQMAVEWLKWAKKSSYSVPYWEIGNELNGQWELGHFLPDGSRMTGEAYAKVFVEYAEALKRVDGSVKVGGPASSDLSLAFVEELLRDAGGLVDFISFHAYPVGVQRTEVANMFNDIDLLREALAKIRHWKGKYQPARYDQIEIAVTEWNMKVNEDRDTVDLINALWSAAWIGAMFEGEVSLANQWDLLTRTEEGGHGAFFYQEGKIVPTALYWALFLWSNHMGNVPVKHSRIEEGLLESFASASADGVQVMLINPSENRSGPIRIALPEDCEFSDTARLTSFSHRQYFWDPHLKRPLWSRFPDVREWQLGADSTLEVPPQCIQILEIPFAGKAPKAKLTKETTGKPSLRLVLPSDADADLPIDGWVVAWDAANEAPYSGDLASISLRVEGAAEAFPATVEMVAGVGHFMVQPSGLGLINIEANSEELTVSQSVMLNKVSSRVEVIWMFGNPISEWGASGTFPLRMEPSVKPNEFVADAVLESVQPADNADVLMLLEAIPEQIDKNRIGGLVGELQASDDFMCDDPEARVSVVLQSEADHWIPLGSVKLEEMRGKWQHFDFNVKEPRLLGAMSRLYCIRFQLQSESPVTGHIYFDNIGFKMRVR